MFKGHIRIAFLEGAAIGTDSPASPCGAFAMPFAPLGADGGRVSALVDRSFYVRASGEDDAKALLQPKAFAPAYGRYGTALQHPVSPHLSRPIAA